MSNQNAVRAVIESALRNLAEELGRFEQTTHGSLYFRDNDIGPIIFSLGEAYRAPTPYRVSELSQSIRHFLRNRPAIEVPT